MKERGVGMAYFSNWRITRTSILFVVGVVVLAGIVFGGVWLAKERGEQARRDEAVKIAEQNLKDQSEVAINKANEAVKQSNEGSDNASTSTTGTTSETQTTATQTASELPQTGPEFSSVIIVTILSLAVAFYVSSRKAVQQR